MTLRFHGTSVKSKTVGENAGNWHQRRLAVLLVVVLAAASLAGAPQGSQDVTFPASDGVTIAAQYYSPGRPGPAVLLLHQCGQDGRSWASFGAALAANGVHALAMTYRPPPVTDQRIADDVDAAFANLKARAGVDARRVAVAGASCGVDNGILLAARSNQISALLLLSGPASPPAGGLAYLRTHPTIPIFAASSATEAESVNASRAVTATSTNPATILRIVSKPGHGTRLFETEPGLFDAAVAWMLTVLK